MYEREAQTAKIFARAHEKGELRKDVDIKLATDIVIAFAWQRLLTRHLDLPAKDLQIVAGQFSRGMDKLWCTA